MDRTREPLLARFFPTSGGRFEHRLFQGLSLLSFLILLLLVLPVNLLQGLPSALNLLLFLFALACLGMYLATLRGRFLIKTLFFLYLAILDLGWFLNGGSGGTMAMFLLTAILYLAVFFQGRVRWLLLTAYLANAAALFGLERAFPAWILPYPSEGARYLDVLTSFFICSAIFLLIVGMVLASYHREQATLLRARLALETSEGHLREAQSMAHLGHWETDHVTGQTTWSAEVFRIHGREAPIPPTFQEFQEGIHPEDRASLVDTYEGHLRRREPSAALSYRLLRPDGEIRHIRNHCRTEYSPEGQPLRTFGTDQDITEHVRVDTALRESEQLYLRTFHSLPYGLGIARMADGRFLAVNEGFQELFGYTEAEILGRSSVELRIWGDPEDRRRVTAKLRAGERVRNHPLRIRRKDGTLRWVAYSGEQVVLGGQPCLLSSAVDISEQRRAEEEHQAMAEALHQAQKLESLGVLAGGIAHDFNNLMAAMMGNLNLAQASLGPDSSARAPLASLERTVLRAAELTQQILAYSGKGRFQIEPRNLNDSIEEMLHLLKVTLSKKIELRLDLAPGLPRALTDSAQVQQVLMNLFTNASDAIGEAVGRITVRTEVVELDGAAVRTFTATQALEPGNYVHLAVSDTGCGMDPETQGHIFEPFFSTKPFGRGLGLSSMLGILKAHHAGIRVQSKPGHGSTFSLYFPVHLDTVLAQPPPAAATTPETLSGTILFVDDEMILLESIGYGLELMGFQVLMARDGMDALDRFRAESTRIDLVLMDVSMPRMDGVTAFRAMHEFRPEIPVVLTSGYDEQIWGKDSGIPGLAGFIQKPYRIAELKTLLQRVLAGSHGTKGSP
jgi:two-component system, cell cycle sensor histidine kinase and response regulator CckA